MSRDFARVYIPSYISENFNIRLSVFFTFKSNSDITFQNHFLAFILISLLQAIGKNYSHHETGHQ